MSGLKNTNKKQALLQSSRSQSRLNINKQSQQTEIFDFSLNSKNKLGSQQSLLTCPNKNKKSLDQSKGSLLYELTAKERQMISDLSKIFVAQNPNRKKISIKINQIKRCHLKNEDCQGCLNCRIDRIQITRLPDSGKIEIPEVIPQFKHIPQISEVLFEINTSSENKMSALKKSGIQFKQRMRSKSKFKSLKIIRTIAITYKPQYSECNYSHIRSFNKAPFIKFRQGSGRESPKSNVSINQDMLFDDQLSQNSTQEKNNTQEKNKAQGNELAFIKILDLNSFVRRKHVERQMLGISNAANQKISVQYKKLKEMLSQQRNEFNHKIQELTKHNQKLNAQLQNERAQKAKFYEQVQNLKKSLKQVREVKQIFLRQNNNLKEKIKQNDKTIQEMRRELNRIRNGELPNHTNLNKINSTKNLVDCSKKIPTHDRNYLTQMEKSNTFNLQLKQPSKVAASSCTRSITRRIQPKRDNKEQNSNQSSAKSQRTIGIRKNSPSVNVNLVQQKNQIIIANNYDTDYVNSSHMYASKDEKQIRSIKSVSNYSELSSSISQSVGYVKKPADEAHKGMLVDYMLQEPNEKNVDLPKQSERQNGQFRQQSNRATGPPRERFQYKSIK